MFYNRVLNAKISSLHFRALKIIFNNSDVTFEELLKLNGSSTIHHQNIKSVAIEMFKVKRNLSPEFMSEFFPSNTNSDENVSHFTRKHNDFYNSFNPKTVNKGICSLRHFGTIVWSTIPQKIRNSKKIY